MTRSLRFCCEMSDRLPLVLDESAQIERLQPGDALDLPINEVVFKLRKQVALLCQTLADYGFELPDELENI